jgi:hypothetical protein
VKTVMDDNRGTMMSKSCRHIARGCQNCGHVRPG